ncbi:UbiX family flavin prenyltransferase [Desulfoscipio gibsoniae]|uniref:Flavin prenyltransferase UbiX n=1 Tax=Desulfoscipio gibsoniae DSM 7213 TaxID=767817 RepID=R4KQ97_9FIRM|nr:UbiX family flavin prenyltransferase [Desulfoscipio gibsoniae]AGL01816.1 polyprenyl p-hydroxybenzoate/phenylacrylic acid decarboxylase [Desulfoscipio gibsoniae DSM 7213]
MKIVVGISGASGAIYGIRALEALRQCGVETHLVISKSAKITISMETNYRINDVEALADYVYENENIGAAIASGSFKHDGMIVAPCSIKSLSAIANSYNDNLLVRAADVALKEKRKLLVIVRETPLHIGHLRLLVTLAELGGTILPPVPAFYHQPKTIDDIVNQTVGKALDQFGIEHQLFRRWEGS